MWGQILSVITGPFFGLALKAYSAKLEANGQHDNKVTELALKELELDGREAQLNSDRKNNILGHWTAPENLFAYFIAFPYWFTVITLDFLIFPAFGIEHATAPLKGETAAIMAMIMTFWFGKRALTSIASIIAGAFGKR